jgi:hypothetical protein
MIFSKDLFSIRGRLRYMFTVQPKPQRKESAVKEKINILSAHSPKAL